MQGKSIVIYQGMRVVLGRQEIESSERLREENSEKTETATAGQQKQNFRCSIFTCLKLKLSLLGLYENRKEDKMC